MESTQISNVVVEGGNSVTSAPSIANESVFGYFWNAGLLIKLVMLALLVSSIWSWSLIITKYLKLKKSFNK
jgi:biopolymer transport protein TolQ